MNNARIRLVGALASVLQFLGRFNIQSVGDSAVCFFVRAKEHYRIMSLRLNGAEPDQRDGMLRGANVRHDEPVGLGTGDLNLRYPIQADLAGVGDPARDTIANDDAGKERVFIREDLQHEVLLGPGLWMKPASDLHSTTRKPIDWSFAVGKAVIFCSHNDPNMGGAPL